MAEVGIKRLQERKENSFGAFYFFLFHERVFLSFPSGLACRGMARKGSWREMCGLLQREMGPFYVGSKHGQFHSVKEFCEEPQRKIHLICSSKCCFQKRQ
ncbi:hypothetical protein CEXT_179961 [Caerostris extrusa]|uniref:Uncharacterized protein n=1 Tax=Caerostris extrusa TaxID=172846 RepID=A0AAV4QC44_CAEEX|nr:hypothetical protein CEXT_179961 [Caerostris extrusa]